MKPTKETSHAVELVDILLRDGVVIAADVVVSVAEIPLIGVQLRLALAGMTELTEHEQFTEWDESIRKTADPDGM